MNDIKQYNRPVAKILQCTRPISYDAPCCNINVYIFATKWCIVGYSSSELWALWDRYITTIKSNYPTPWLTGDPNHFLPSMPIKYAHVFDLFWFLVFSLSFCGGCMWYIDSYTSEQNGRRFADVISSAYAWVKSLFFIRISLNFVPKGLIDNNPALV